MSTDAFSDPLVGAGLLLGLAALILVVGLVLQIPARRRQRKLSATEVLGDESAPTASLADAENSPDLSPSPGDAWLKFVPPWIDELESRVSWAFEVRLEEVQQELEVRIDGVEDKFLSALDGVEDELDLGLDKVDEKISLAAERLEHRQWRAEFEARMDEVHGKVERMDLESRAPTDSAMNNHSPVENGVNGHPLEGQGAMARQPATEDRHSRSEDTVARAMRNLFRSSRPRG